MNKLDKFCLKQIVLYLDGESLAIQKIVPTNSNELSELRELAEKGLTKLLIVDASTSFIVHKGIEQKLIDDLSVNKITSRIIERSQQGHNLIQIHASNIWLRKLKLTPSQFQQLILEEDLILNNYNKTI